MSGVLRGFQGLLDWQRKGCRGICLLFQTFVEALDGIIRELMPLGRSEESMDND